MEINNTDTPEPEQLSDSDNGRGAPDQAATAGESNGALCLDADAIIDNLVPQAIDWRDTVRSHPLGSLSAVALVGYLVGRTKGAVIMTGLTAAISSALTRQLSDVFEGDFFDFD